MIEVGCTCEVGCGVTHSHLGRRAEVRFENGRTGVLHERDAALNPDLPVLRWLEDEVRPWVDWRQVAREVGT